MEKETLSELDGAIRKCIIGMKKVEVFDSHSILNHVYFNHRALFDRIVKEDKPRTPEEWVAFRRRFYGRISACSGDLIEVMEKKQSWSVLFDGSFGPCTYWRKLTKAERDAAKAVAQIAAPKRSAGVSAKRKATTLASPKTTKKPKR